MSSYEDTKNFLLIPNRKIDRPNASINAIWKKGMGMQEPRKLKNKKNSK